MAHHDQLGHRGQLSKSEQPGQRPNRTVQGAPLMPWVPHRDPGRKGVAAEMKRNATRSDERSQRGENWALICIVTKRCCCCCWPSRTPTPTPGSQITIADSCVPPMPPDRGRRAVQPRRRQRQRRTMRHMGTRTSVQCVLSSAAGVAQHDT